MTYCVAMSVDAGVVFISDSRTNAGVDQVSTYRKMHRYGRPGERQFVILSAGNLATTQSVMAQVRRDNETSDARSLMTAVDPRDAADYLGQLSRMVQDRQGGGPTFEANFIIGGQVGGSRTQIYMIYPQGNYITTSADTCYLQIGESKYGKPILDRIIRPDSTLETCALCGLVSMDSTMRSNITVGPPIEVQIYERDALALSRHYVYTEDSEYLRELHRQWDDNLREAFERLPPVEMDTVLEHQGGGR